MLFDFCFSIATAACGEKTNPAVRICSRDASVWPEESSRDTHLFKLLIWQNQRQFPSFALQLSKHNDVLFAGQFQTHIKEKVSWHQKVNDHDVTCAWINDFWNLLCSNVTCRVSVCHDEKVSWRQIIYTPVFKASNGKSTLYEDLNGKHIYKWWTFNRHIWFLLGTYSISHHHYVFRNYSEVRSPNDMTHRWIDKQVNILLYPLQSLNLANYPRSEMANLGLKNHHLPHLTLPSGSSYTIFTYIHPNIVSSWQYT